MTEILKKRFRKQAQNPTPETRRSSLDYILSNPLEFIEELRAIGREANDRKASVLLDLVKVERPDIYQFGESLIEVEPELARDALIRRWPILILARLKYPQESLQLIAFLQTQIKQRREDNQYDSQNGKRQIANRSGSDSRG